MSSGGLRHRAREIALQILYRYDGEEHRARKPAELVKELQDHYEHFEAPEGAREFAGELVAGTLAQREELDGLIERHSSHWKVNRMATVDRTVLRMATYELRAVLASPAKVVIDEAVELAKQFGTTESPAFINGVLDAIRVSLGRSV